MSDPAEDIADALVTYVSALTDQTTPSVSQVAEVRKTDDPLSELERERDTLRVLFHASSEDSERIGRGGEVFERFVISMMVVKKLDGVMTKAVLSIFTRELKAAIRGVAMAGCKFGGDATPVKTDNVQMQMGQYCSVSEFTYSKAGRGA